MADDYHLFLGRGKSLTQPLVLSCVLGAGLCEVFGESLVSLVEGDLEA